MASNIWTACPINFYVQGNLLADTTENHHLKLSAIHRPLWIISNKNSITVFFPPHDHWFTKFSMFHSQNSSHTNTFKSDLFTSLEFFNIIFVYMYSVSRTDLMLCFSLLVNRKTHKAKKKNNYKLSGHNSTDNFVKITWLLH